jgi:hypothetical protein
MSLSSQSSPSHGLAEARAPIVRHWLGGQCLALRTEQRIDAVPEAVIVVTDEISAADCRHGLPAREDTLCGQGARTGAAACLCRTMIPHDCSVLDRHGAKLLAPS